MGGKTPQVFPSFAVTEPDLGFESKSKVLLPSSWLTPCKVQIRWGSKGTRPFSSWLSGQTGIQPNWNPRWASSSSPEMFFLGIHILAMTFTTLTVKKEKRRHPSSLLSCFTLAQANSTLKAFLSLCWSLRKDAQPARVPITSLQAPKTRQRASHLPQHPRAGPGRDLTEPMEMLMGEAARSILAYHYAPFALQGGIISAASPRCLIAALTRCDLHDICSAGAACPVLVY